MHIPIISISTKKMQSNTYNSMTSINLRHVSTLGYHPQGVAYNKGIQMLCFVDGAYRQICVKKTNLMHCLSSVYFVNQPLHVSGISVAHQQEVYCV